MTSERDIFLVANIILEIHGASAEKHAESRADNFANKGDEAGRVVWLRIAEAVWVLGLDKGECIDRLIFNQSAPLAPASGTYYFALARCEGHPGDVP